MVTAGIAWSWVDWGQNINSNGLIKMNDIIINDDYRNNWHTHIRVKIFSKEKKTPQKLNKPDRQL